MQNRNVNEVMANNSTHTPAPIVRITQEQYSALANHIFDECLDTYGKPLSIDWEDAHSYTFAKFLGYCEGKSITTIDIEMITQDADGDELANDFSADTFKAHLRELTAHCFTC